MSEGLPGLLAQGGGWPVVVIIAALLIGLVLRTRGQAELRRRVKRLEEQALRGSSAPRRDPSVSRPATPPTAPAAPDSLTMDVLDQLRAGRKIEAIKRYRQATGLGLKEAKDAVEAIERAARPR